MSVIANLLQTENTNIEFNFHHKTGKAFFEKKP